MIGSAAAPSRPTTAPQSRRYWLALLPLLLLGVFLLNVAIGSVRVPLTDVIAALTGGETTIAAWGTIVRVFRLPKAFTALLAGAALAVSGLQMQTLFRNPLAGPFVLGINAGASLGVALVVLAAGSVGATLLAGLGFLGGLSIALAASLGAGTVLLAVMVVARRVETTTLLILGLMFGYAASALVSVLLFFSIAEQIQAYIAWTFGSFGGVTWSQLRILAPAIGAALLLAWLSAKPLNALLLGERYARSLGLAVRPARIAIIASAAVLAGTVTAYCGPIGFIGVAVPHLGRSLINTSDHRQLVPATMMLGGIVALIADIIAQLPGSQTILPLNAVTALIGAPVITWVILRRRNLAASFSS